MSIQILNALASDHEIFDGLRFGEDNDMFVLSSKSPHVQITKALKDEIDLKLKSPLVSDAKCFRLLIQSLIDDDE